MKTGGLSIGMRNIVAAENALRRRELDLNCREVGGKHGRTVRFNVAEGKMSVRTMDKSEITERTPDEQEGM